MVVAIISGSIGRSLSKLDHHLERHTYLSHNWVARLNNLKRELITLNGRVLGQLLIVQTLAQSMAADNKFVSL